MNTLSQTVLRVSATSHSTAVAGAIAGVVREQRNAQVGAAVIVAAIGAGAVNQAIKAVAIARGYLVEDGLDLALVPQFANVDINGEERTAVRFYVESRPRDPDAPYAVCGDGDGHIQR